MSAEVSAALAGLALIAVELVRSVPALRRVQRTGTSDGVSGMSLGVLAGTGLGWLALAVMVQSWWVLAANILWIVIHAFLCREVARTDARKNREIVLAGAGSAAALAVATIGARFFMPVQDALGIMLGVSTLFYAIPAAYEGLASASTRGLSLVSLGVNTLEGTIYFLAGVAVLNIAESADPVFGFAFFGVVSIASNGVRFVRVAYRRIKAARPGPAGGRTRRRGPAVARRRTAEGVRRRRREAPPSSVQMPGRLVRGPPPARTLTASAGYRAAAACARAAQCWRSGRSAGW